jgi:hypothetical protein
MSIKETIQPYQEAIAAPNKLPPLSALVQVTCFGSKSLQGSA